jgi:anti-sigma B factor antagonist
MSIKLAFREVGDVTIIDCAGRITLDDEGAGLLREALRDLVGQNKKKVILNLAETSDIDSCGLGEMMSGLRMLESVGAEFKLLAPGKRLKESPLITKLYRDFEVHEYEAAAVHSFR